MVTQAHRGQQTSVAPPLPWVVRFLPSLTDIVFLMPILFLFLTLDGAKSMLGDGDTGWHIRTGEWIIENGQVPHADIFSFTKAGEPWFAWEWLWDVAFAWVHQHAGMTGVVLINILMISTTFTLLFRLVRRVCSNDWISFAVSVLAMAGSSIHWLARPHLVTLLFVVIFYSVLERAQDNPRLLYLLPGLTVIWTNLHGGFFVGIILIATYAMAELLKGCIGAAEPIGRTIENGMPYIWCGMGCALASFVNPYSYHLHLHIIEYLSDPFQLRNISEFQSISFQNPVAVYFELMLLLGMAAVLWNLARMQFVYVFLVTGWAHLALISARNIPIFLIVTAPVVAHMLDALLAGVSKARVRPWLGRNARRVQEFAEEFRALDRIGRVHLFTGIVILLLCIILFGRPDSTKFKAEYDSRKYPAKALAVLRGSDLSARIFTHDEWGDYLIYRLYPTNLVFVDGRSDFYGPKFGEKYLDVMNVKYDWERNLSRYGVDTVLLPPDAALSSTLKESKRWRIVYDDGVAIVFRATRTNQVSAVVQNGGKDRDRTIAQYTQRSKS